MDELECAAALVGLSGEKLDGRKPDPIAKIDALLAQARGLENIALADYPPIDWTVTNLLPPGFAIFSGGSKLGKTWLCLQLASAVALGLDFLGNNEYPCKKGEVLLLALQISDRILHNRMEIAGILGDDKVHVLHKFPRGDEALTTVRRWKELHPAVCLVIIDMLEQIRDRDPEHENTYSVNVQEISQWAQLADELKITILGTTHDRKALSGDFVNDIMGSVGSSGSAATLWSLKRCRGRADAVLFASGWEIIDHELPLEFDPKTAWTLVLGSVSLAKLTRERQEVINLLNENPEGLSPTDIAEALERKPGSIRWLLLQMKKVQLVQNTPKGLYISSSSSSTTTTTTNMLTDSSANATNTSTNKTNTANALTHEKEKNSERVSGVSVSGVSSLLQEGGPKTQLSTKVDNLCYETLTSTKVDNPPPQGTPKHATPLADNFDDDLEPKP